MTTQQQINLLSGATETQLKNIQNKQNAQADYMKFVRTNPSLDMSDYESKYEEIMNAIK